MPGNPLFYRPMVRTGPELLREQRDRAIEAMLTQAGISYAQVQAIVRQASMGATIPSADRELLRRAKAAVEKRLSVASAPGTEKPTQKTTGPAYRTGNLRRYLELLEHSI